MLTKDEHKRLAQVCEHVNAIVALLTEPETMEPERRDYATQVLISLATTMAPVVEQYRETLPGEH